MGVTRGRPIRRVLIANRGEIAVRIARAAHESGIVALGVYSEADRTALHVEAMDDAACIGPGPAAQSYLDAARVLGAARELGADAVHPGYGFLSERAAFARAVVEAGLTFVGPTPAAIAAMGDKIEAKRRARAHGVPVLPGYEGEDRSLATLRAEAANIGLPLLIKASAGGGGRGMRVVDDLERFEESLDAARREALAAFGDATVLLEKYLARPRHIEFQILADAYGHTVHVGERECSIQRRHQKVVEEAPSVALDAPLRERMGAAAVRAAESVGYTNAGTVEFLLDEDGAFYFLEMNARLQVEHPVTELVHGIDLVRSQFALAAGEPLALQQSGVTSSGWAIEVRLNAEDPDKGFLPAAGTLSRFEPPSEGPGLRLDSGVRAGSDVSIYYDSLLAKLIAFGPDRAAAIGRLTRALEAFRIEGVPTNLGLLARIARNAAFRAGDTTTAFLVEQRDDLEPPASAAWMRPALLAVGALLGGPRAWRIGGVGVALRLRGEGPALDVTASRTGGDDMWRLEGDLSAEVAFERAGDHVAARWNGERCGGRAMPGPQGVDVIYEGRPYRFALAAPPELGSTGAAGGGRAGAITSPMPGKVIKVAVRPGDTVAERDLLVVLEAMKMEHRIEATRDGVVGSVPVEAGALVRSGATLVEMEP